MKMSLKEKLKSAVVAAVVTVFAAAAGAGTASALSTEGESVLNVLSSVGSSIGIDIGGLIPTAAPTTVPPVLSENAAVDLDRILAGLNLGVTDIIDIVNSLQKGESFENIILEKYGKNIYIPDSVREMPAKELVMYLMSAAVNGNLTASPEGTTDYQFVPSSKENEKETSEKETSENSGLGYIPTASATASQEQTMAASLTVGDVNGDGRISAVDARLTLRIAAGLDVFASNSAELIAADADSDGKVTARDARSILRYSAGLISEF